MSAQQQRHIQTEQDTVHALAGARAATVETVAIAGVPVMLQGIRETASLYLECIFRKRRQAYHKPVLASSMNGQTIVEVSLNKHVAEQFRSFSLNSMDGQPAVLLSRRWPRAFTERVATTDLVHAVIEAGLEQKVRHYFLGGRPGVAERACQMLRRQHEGVVIAGWRDGYFKDGELARVAFEIEATAPDMVWICMGVPREQAVSVELAELLREPALLKTGGGLLDFLAGDNPRAPKWMQDAGLEWLFRTVLEPRRLLWRYVATNPLALVHLLLLRPAYAKTAY